MKDELTADDDSVNCEHNVFNILTAYKNEAWTSLYIAFGDGFSAFIVCETPTWCNVQYNIVYQSANSYDVREPLIRS